MKKQFQDITNQVSEAKARLVQAIRDLPDSAGGVKMLTPNCCTVSSSQIAQHGFNLSPRYWLTHETKTQLIALVDSSRTIESTVNAVEAVLTTGKLKDGSKIPPNVLEALKKAWEGYGELT
jgi:hypothetical protein